MSLFDHEKEAQKNMQYMHDVDEAMNRRGHPWAFTLSLSVVAFFLIFFVWAANAQIDDVTRGMGQIIPAQGVQPIQSERGGTINDILVSENDMVERNQPVVNLSNVPDATKLAELQSRSIELYLSLKRLSAEEKDQPLNFSDEEQERYPDAVTAQMRIYQTRKEQFEGESRLLVSRIEQRKNDVTENQKRRQTHEHELLLLQEKEAAYRPMVGRSITELEYLELKQNINSKMGDLNTVAQTIAKAESGVHAAEEALKNLHNNRQASIADEMNKTRMERSSILQQITASDEKVTRTELRSPVRGKVVRVLLKKEGVAKPAETILEIIPTDGALEVEARFSPQDRGFLFVNQPAMVKVSAYDFSIYGGLEAVVTKISTDTIEDKRGDPWYEVRFITKRKSILYRGEELEILPGMTVTVDVLTDKKSVLSHIIGPVRRAMQNAMTEH